jgi:exopolysaccharide biosynthesis protein
MPTSPKPRTPNRLRKTILASSLAVTLAAGGTTAWALDRFVVEKVEISDVSAYEAEQAGSTDSETAAATDSATDSTTDTATGTDTGTDTGSDTDTETDGVLTDTSYTSEDSSIEISTVVTGSGDETVTYYVADVELTDATTLRSAFADDSFGENITETTSAIAEANNAVFAINGDYYGFRDTGIVIRNGVVYRDEGARQGLAFYTDGTVQVYDETTTTAAQLLADGVWNTLSFGPSLLDDGEIAAGIEDVEVDTNFGNHSIQGEQPRTAVGVIDENHLVFVVVDGRSDGYSDGVTMTELAGILQGLGATTAYNIDGGGSSTMYFGGELVNNPLGKGEERATSDILYIGQ